MIQVITTILSIISFFLGIFSNYYFFEYQNHLFLFIPLFFIIVLIIIIPKIYSLSKLPSLSVLIIFTFFLFGIFIINHTEKTFNQQKLITFNDQGEFNLTGKICEQIYYQKNKQKLTVCLNQIKDNNNNILASENIGKILITTNQYFDLQFGQIISFQVKPKTPLSFSDFDYLSYLKNQGIVSIGTVYKPQEDLKIISPASFWDKLNPINLNFFLEKQLNKIFHPNQSWLISALLLGNKKSLNPQITDNFRHAWLAHLIVVSGYHLTLLIWLLSLFTKNLSRKKKLIIGILFILFFLLLTGSGTSTIRASIMGILTLIALNFGQQKSPLLLIFWSAFFMVLFNPYFLLFDLGFHLSFLSLLGIIYLEPIIFPFLTIIPTHNLRKIVSITLSATLLTLPSTIFHFNNISTVFLLSNILIPIVIPIIMIGGGISLFFSFFSLTIGQFWWFLITPFIDYSFWMVEKLLAIPYSFIENLSLGLTGVIISYFLLGSFLIYKNRPHKNTFLSTTKHH